LTLSSSILVNLESIAAALVSVASSFWEIFPT